jgi:hypothetical protein
MKNTVGREVAIGRGINGMGDKVWMYVQECADGTWVGYYQSRKKLPVIMCPVDYWPSRETAEAGMRAWSGLGQTSEMTATGPMHRSLAAHILRSIPSEKRSEASRANGAKGGRPISTTSALEKLQNGAEPESLRFTCEADDGQGNSYWVRRQGATIIRLNRFQDNETGAIEWSDDVSGWEK